MPDDEVDKPVLSVRTVYRLNAQGRYALRDDDPVNQVTIHDDSRELGQEVLGLFLGMPMEALKKGYDFRAIIKRPDHTFRTQQLQLSMPIREGLAISSEVLVVRRCG